MVKPVQSITAKYDLDLCGCLVFEEGQRNQLHGNKESILFYKLGKILFQKIEKAEPVWLDRWQIVVSDVAPGLPIEPSSIHSSAATGDPVPYNIINNYFSIGVVRNSIRYRKSAIPSNFIRFVSVKTVTK